MNYCVTWKTHFDQENLINNKEHKITLTLKKHLAHFMFILSSFFSHDKKKKTNMTINVGKQNMNSSNMKEFDMKS